MENNNLVKKSVFRQEKKRRIYSFIEQMMMSSYFSSNNTYYSMIMNTTESMSDNEIFTCNIEMPMLEVGEEFYIEELNKVVKINKRVRSSKESVCYYLEPEIIDDEKSDESRIKAERLQEKYESIKGELNGLKEFKEKVEKSFWFRFIK